MCIVANRCEPASDPGTCTIGTGGAMAGLTRSTTSNYSTATVTGTFTMVRSLTAPAASRKRRPRMPEPDDGKLSRPVPRGREAGNGLLLPDSVLVRTGTGVQRLLASAAVLLT